MIVVLSLNTAVDRVVVVPGFEPGEVYRAQSLHLFAGGKGLNVARTVRALEERVQVIGFLGGAPASLIERLSGKQDPRAHWVPTAEESRTCTIVVDPDNGRQTVINEPGPGVSTEEVEELWQAIGEHVAPGNAVAVSGSAPPGAPEMLHRDLISALQRGGAQVLVDAAGDTLRSSLEARPWAAAPNEQECAAALGPGEPLTLVRRLAELTEHALLTRGRNGALYAGPDGVWTFRPPAIQAVNAVGSGDACVGGFLTGMVRGLGPVESVRLGMACGAANAARLEPGIGDGTEIERLVRAVEVEMIVPGHE